jgi:adenylate kinase family enzyme
VPHTVPVRRISVVGNTGSGKTTLATGLAAALGVPHLELDSVFHQAGWQPLDRETFRERVASFTARPSWVVDGNYSAVRDIVWARADTVVWVDPPRHRVMRQLIWRTLRRMATRAELWNGNREQWRFLFNRAESIIAWAWTNHHRLQERHERAQADPANGHLTFIRLRTPGESEAFLQAACERSGLLRQRHYGGTFDPAIGSYLSNVVAFARQIGVPSRKSSATAQACIPGRRCQHGWPPPGSAR